MSLVAIPVSAWERGVDWRAVKWYGAAQILGVVAGVCAGLGFFNLDTVFFSVGFFFLRHLSIRLGAHSLYTHQAYMAAYPLHVVWVLLFAATLQGPLLVWVMLHILHHKFTDRERDPYSPKHGWLWAHMLWTFFNLPKFGPRDALWLLPTKDKTAEERKVINLIAWQAKYHWQLGVGLGIVLPALVPMLWGDWFGGLPVALLALFCQYHFTWQINSLSHLVGPQPYTKEDSSHDSPWWLFGVPSILSVGEASRHNRHHKFPSDFRIGNRWWNMDAGKWVLYMLWALSQPMVWAGRQPLVWDLKRFDDDGTLRLLH